MVVFQIAPTPLPCCPAFFTTVPKLLEVHMSDLKTSTPASSDAAFDTHLHGVVWEARADTGELTRFGGEARKILGSYAELSPGKPRFSSEIFHPDDRVQVADALKHLRASGEPVLFDARVVTGAPEPVWVRTVVRAEDRESIQYLRGVSFDISDLKRADACHSSRA